MEVKINRVQSPTSNVQCQQKLKIVFLITIILLVIPINLHSFTWDKVSYGIGYSGGINYSGDDLKQLSVVEGLMPSFYWLNSIEGSLIYSVNENLKVESGLSYGWVYLSDRNGLALNISGEETDTNQYYVKTSYWDISLLSGFIGLRIGNSFITGVALSHCYGSTEELLYTGGIIGPSRRVSTTRKCIGATIFCGWEGSSMFGVSNLKPFLKLQLGWAKEYQNSAPWEWDEKLTVGLTGIYLGMRFEVGG